MTECRCRVCLDERDAGFQSLDIGGQSFKFRGMILCATCGNKRCPHATDHRLACTGSNDPGQIGSDYA